MPGQTPHYDKLREAKDLWRACFHDDEAFVDFYFLHCAKSEETLISYDTVDKPIGHIGLPTYYLGLWGNQEVEATYISGACVLPEYRGQGLMRQMMNQVICQRHHDAVILIPADNALRSYYQRTFGFDNVGTLTWTDDLSAIEEAVSPPKNEDLAEFFSQSRRRYFGIHQTREQCQNILLEYSLYPDFGRVITATDTHGQYTGLLLARCTPSVVYIDYIAGDAAVRTELVETIREDYPQRHIQVRIRERHTSDSTPHGMIRLCRVIPFLQAWLEANTLESFAFSYRDSLLPKLSGSYHGIAGEVMFTPDAFDFPEITHGELVGRFLPSLDISLLHE